MSIVGASHGNIHDKWEVTEELLGSGAFSDVFLATNRETKEKVAVKCIYKKRVERTDQLAAEIALLIQLKNHPKIVALFEAFTNEKCVFLVLELMSSSNLYDEIVERDHLTERQASIVFEQVLEGLAFIHKSGIVHRDIKLENILVKNKGDLSCVKISDFGLSKNIQDSAPVTAVGTPFYVAPDLLEAMETDSPYTLMIDMWAMGVLLFIILSGRLPFTGEDDQDLYDNILEAKIIWKKPQFDSVSKEAKDLISRLLTKKPTDRLTAEASLKHEWILLHKQSKLEAVRLHGSLSQNLQIHYNYRPRNQGST